MLILYILLLLIISEIIKRIASSIKKKIMLSSLTNIFNNLFYKDITAENCSTKLRETIREMNKFTPIGDRKTISEVTKRQLWRKEANGKMDSKCFCCHTHLGMDQQYSKNEKKKASWHAGHILSAAHGGPDDVDNLKILCYKCNTTMNSCHLYEYMIINSTKGISDIPWREYWKYKKVISTNEKCKKILSSLNEKSIISLSVNNSCLSHLDPKKFPLSFRQLLIDKILASEYLVK
jgi:5-methylcytosine-specific restriction endonuclease McrA